MPKKKPKQHKPRLARYIVLTAVLLIAFTVFFLAINKQQTLGAEKARLDAAGADLRVMYDLLMDKYQVSASERHFNYKCYESSAKYGRGVVSCGAYGNQTITSGNLEEARQLLAGEIKGSASFHADFRDEGEAEIEKYLGENVYSFRLSFTHISTQIQCIATGRESIEAEGIEVDLDCSTVVSDFLPGYGKEN